MSVEWQKPCCFEVKIVYSVSNGGDGDCFVVVLVFLKNRLTNLNNGVLYGCDRTGNGCQ
jgi:hypothetical protein